MDYINVYLQLNRLAVILAPNQQRELNDVDFSCATITVIIIIIILLTIFKKIFI